MRFPSRTLSLTVVSLSLAACSAELKKLDGDAAEKDPDVVVVDPIPPDDGGAYQYRQAPQQGQRCVDTSCRDVSVYVHYMVAQELGDGKTVAVEAFDNQHFEGAPVAVETLRDFRARTGEWRELTLPLPAGDYYVRAYLTTEADPNVPYPLGGMQPADQTPVGVYGALAAPKAVHVAPYWQEGGVDPVHVNLDQLFVKPGSEPDTKARLRVTLAVPADATIPDQRKVIVRLHDSTDLARDPKYSWDVATERFLVQGRPGQTELLTPSLAEGDFILFAFLDANANGFHDDGELAAVYKEDGQPKKLAVRKERTESVTLALTAKPDLPR